MNSITISGTPGSGKSTVGKLLEEKTNLRYVYSGLIFREISKKYNMSLDEFGKYCESHEDVDKQLDDYQLEILKRGNVILEGRLAGWISYRNDISALKILIDADIDIRAHRIVNREDGEFEKRKKEMIDREKSEAKRYLNYYGIDINDRSIYDIIIDSGNKTPEKIVCIILDKYNKNKS